MNNYIVLNGEKIENLQIKPEDFVICTDGAYNFLKNKKITPKVVLGDFDSLGYIPENSIVFPCDKDYTDGELALIKAKEIGLEKVIITCAGGLRDDHFLGNIALLEISNNLKIDACLETVYSYIYFVNDFIRLNTSADCIISVIALENSKIEYSKGLKYKYDNTELKTTSTLGISNVATSDFVEIKVGSGRVLVVKNK